MLHEVFRTKERKIIAAIILVVIIIISILIFTGYSYNRQFVEQAVMAENYLEAGNYDSAADAYLKALSMKKGDEQLLTIGLADAYAGMDDFDKALEVLRSCYGKTSDIKVIEKIEEITSAKTDYDYLQSISLAEVYFSNKEYDKAIAEFENAKLIKSKEALSYQRIAEAYIILGKYDLAKEEIIEGQEITQDKGLDKIMDIVETSIKKEHYDALIAQAAEYILQENFKDGITKYNEAISLLPGESIGYSELAKFYISQKEYDKAISLLQEAMINADSDELKNLKDQAIQQSNLEKVKITLLPSLYKALEIRNFPVVTMIMDLAAFKEAIPDDSPVFYYAKEGDNTYDPCLIIYDNITVYYGDVRDDMKTGNGIYFTRTVGDPEPGYYYYDGEWADDYPNGYGKTVDVKILLDDMGQKYESSAVTKGEYNHALENGKMEMYYYVNGEKAGEIKYQAVNGIPKQLSEDGNVPSSAKAQNIWGVLPFVNQ